MLVPYNGVQVVVELNNDEHFKHVSWIEERVDVVVVAHDTRVRAERYDEASYSETTDELVHRHHD